jgi:hypothetical protein
MRLIRKLPVSSAMGVANVSLDPSRWERLENAYGCELPETAG